MSSSIVTFTERLSAVLPRRFIEQSGLEFQPSASFLGGGVVFVKGFLCVAFSPKRLHKTTNKTHVQLDLPAVCVFSVHHTFQKWP